LDTSGFGQSAFSSLHSRHSTICCFGTFAFQCVSTASAQTWWDSYQHGEREIQDGYLPSPSLATNLPQKGDPGGNRKWLGERGIVYGIEYINDILSNVRGGTRTSTSANILKLTGPAYSNRLARLGLRASSRNQNSLPTDQNPTNLGSKSSAPDRTI
jgi:hypothetical protein